MGRQGPETRLSCWIPQCKVQVAGSAVSGRLQEHEPEEHTQWPGQGNSTSAQMEAARKAHCGIWSHHMHKGATWIAWNCNPDATPKGQGTVHLCDSSFDCQ